MIKKLHLELGGKDPMVIAPDAEMDMAVSGLAYSSLLNTGQVCTSTERVYVHESMMAQFSEELADFVGIDGFRFRFRAQQAGAGDDDGEKKREWSHGWIG